MNWPSAPVEMQPSRTTIAAPVSPRIRQWFALGVLLFAIQVSPFWWSPTRDAAGYLSIARNLIHGRLENLGSPQLFFAPGYPILISPAFLLGERPFLAIALSHFLLGIGLIAGVYRWCMRIEPAAAVPVTMLVLANVSLWEYYRATLSEFAFTTLLVWAAYALDVAVDAPGKLRLRWVLAGAILAAMTALTRQTGGVLAAGLVIVLAVAVWRKRWKWFEALIAAAVVGCAASGVVLATMYYDRLHAPPGARTYVDFLRNSKVPLGAQLLEGLRVRIFEIGRLVVPGMFGAYNKHHRWLDINSAVYLPVFVGLVWAWWLRVRRNGLSVLTAAWPVYLLFYMVWPFEQSTRFLMPMLPILCLAMWDLVQGLLKRPNWSTRVVAFLVFAHVIVSLGVWLSTYPRVIRANRQWAKLIPLAEQMRAAPGAATGRAATFLPHGQEYYLALLLDRRVEHLETGDKIPEQVHWLIGREHDPAPNDFVLRQSAGECRLWERTAL